MSVMFHSLSMGCGVNAFSVPRSQVFMRAPFVEDLEKQRLKRTNYLLVKLQAVARGRFYRQVLFEILCGKESDGECQRYVVYFIAADYIARFCVQMRYFCGE
jgi:hypothetical protein